MTNQNNDNEETNNQEQQSTIDNNETTITIEQEEEQTMIVPNRHLKVFWGLFGFFRRCLIFFLIIILTNSAILDIPGIARAMFKCLPIITLQVFVFRRCKNLKNFWKDKFSFFVFAGLLISWLSDAFLEFKDSDQVLFTVGLFIASLGLISYACAFGWTPLKSRMLWRTCIAVALSLAFLYTTESGGSVRGKGVEVKVGVGFYVISLFLAQWRSWARISLFDFMAGRVYEILGAFGSTINLIYGGMLLLYPLNQYELLRTFIFYLTQLLIAVSVLDGPSIVYFQDVNEENKRGLKLRVSLTNVKSFFLEFPKLFLGWIFS